MSSDVKPVAGQWYEFDGERIWFVGYGRDGVACFQRENCDPSWVVNSVTSRFKHLPDCTGWDWEPKPLCNGCGKKLLPENAWMEDGCPCNSPKGVNDTQPAEDPEEWVEITDPEHVLRAGVDQYYSNALREWSAIADSHGHKWCKSYLRSYRVRCRRKDLPKPRRTITVPKWLVIYDGSCGTYTTECMTKPPGAQVHRVGETTYEIEGE